MFTCTLFGGCASSNNLWSSPPRSFLGNVVQHLRSPFRTVEKLSRPNFGLLQSFGLLLFFFLRQPFFHSSFIHPCMHNSARCWLILHLRNCAQASSSFSQYSYEKPYVDPSARRSQKTADPNQKTLKKSAQAQRKCGSRQKEQARQVLPLRSTVHLFHLAVLVDTRFWRTSMSKKSEATVLRCNLELSRKSRTAGCTSESSMPFCNFHSSAFTFLTRLPTRMVLLTLEPLSSNSSLLCITPFHGRMVVASTLCLRNELLHKNRVWTAPRLHRARSSIRPPTV